MSKIQKTDTFITDQFIGERIRHRRVLLGLTQDQLGEQIGISYQQVQKYETGANRVSASRLFQIAQILETPVAWFYERHDHGRDVVLGGDTSSRHVIDLVRSFSAIESEKLKIIILSLVRALGTQVDGLEKADTASLIPESETSEHNARF